MIPKRTDGKSMRVVAFPDGSIYVDAHEVRDESGLLLHRGGPSYPRHYHRFEDYHLEDGTKRCYKCGLLENIG